ncbi:MAG TPA: restriction endonuclease subunit S [Burkholderiaceae bacterium]|nr:restriction endonuclease subunit S [Burkholderiaceae bacterium]
MSQEVLPVGWVAAKLGDVALWSSGGTPSRANPNFYTGTIPWFKTGELGVPTLHKSEEYISESAISSSSAKVFPRGSVALAMYGATIGKASILGIDAATNQACAVGVPDAVSSEFLYFFLISQSRAFADAGKGGAQPNISQGIVKEWSMRLPPKPEQTRIVAKLEELLSDLDAGVAELKAAQRKLTLYRQSLLKAAVEGALTADWRARNPPTETGAQLLERILEQRRARWEARQIARFDEQGKVPPKGWRDKYPEPASPDSEGLPALPVLPNGWVWASVEQLGAVQLGRQRSPDKLKGEFPVQYIRAANITEAGIDLDDVLAMDFSKTEQKTFALKQGDVLLTEASGSPEHVGRPAIWQNANGLYCFQNTVLRFTPTVISSEFAFYVFLAMQKLGVFRKLSGGVGINHLSAGKFAKLPVALPPSAEQSAFVDAIASQLSLSADQMAAIEQSLKQSAAQRKNILRAAFSGQLVPQDPADEPASVLLARIRAERAAQAGKTTSTRGGRKAAQTV